MTGAGRAPAPLDVSLAPSRPGGSRGGAKRGTLTAEAVAAGRTTPVIDVRVVDDERRLIATRTATRRAPAG